MGLDMYLEGRRFLRTNWENPEANLKRGKYRVKEETLELAYWRKHPNLHGFIVQTFADGVDECQEINLSADNPQTIIDAIHADALPTTEGFFFGSSDGTEKDSDLDAFKGALEWLNEPEEGVWRDVVYQASW